MASRGPEMSQVGLFSTQISEQILRLRALSQDVDARTEQRAVDLRRAIMATRLLAGSARILKQGSLLSFLDELLQWLQSLEDSPRSATPTQELMLESVIELEEQLMVALEEQTHGQEELDLTPFEEQLQDLVALLRRDHPKAERADTPASTKVRGRTPASTKTPSDTQAPSPEPTVPPSEDESGCAEPTDRLPGSLDELEHSLTAMETQLHGADPQARRATQAKLQAISRRIQSLLSEENAEAQQEKRAEEARPVEPSPTGVNQEPAPVARRRKTARATPAVLRDVGEQLRELEREGWSVDARLSGRAPRLPGAVQELVTEILGHLSRDVVTMARSHPADRTQLQITVELRNDLGRLQVFLRDDAPRATAGALVDDPDHLALLSGLRRACTLIQQANGLIQVEPEDRPSLRYVVTLALDPRMPTYAILPLESQTVAIPWALIEEIVEADTLTFEVDPSGESFVHRGREIPLLDLAQFVPALLPAGGRPGHVAVVGSVEKRLGIAVYQDLELLRPSELLDPPTGWQSVAYAGLERHEQLLPVLDLKRLVQLRFAAPEELKEAGSTVDEFLDSYVPSPEQPTALREDSGEDTRVYVRPPGELEPEPRVGGRSAVLVNQSDFRRRELHRLLERAGFDVLQAADLDHAESELCERSADLLVSDLRLGQGGAGSFHAIRRAHPGTVVLLTSAVAADHAQELAERAGAHACWLEPFRRSDLDQLLRKWRSAVHG